MIEPIKFLEELSKTANPYLSEVNSSDIFRLEYIDKVRDKFKKYEFQGMMVPRVNEILQATVGKEYLMNWAAKLGEEGFKKERARAVNTGSFVHQMIENFLLYNQKFCCDKIYSNDMRKEVHNAFKNFLDWYDDKIKNGFVINIIALERETTNPWFGGTIDCILNLQHCYYQLNQNIILDFKTSKMLSYEYLLQTYAYMWSWNWNRTFIDPILPHIDGVGLLRIDKQKPLYNEFYLTKDSNPYELAELDLALSSMICWFYNMNTIDYQFRNLKGENNGDHIFSRDTSDK